MSWNGSTGLGMEFSEDCVIEDCSLMCNNYRHFNPYWHAGGMKLIPANVRCTVRRCEVAFNFGSCGIWVDGGWEGLANKAMRILDNVCHHNGSTGIFYEINGGGGLIAGNLCFANQGIGIDIQAHLPDPTANEQPRLWVVHNTVADNVEGFRVADRNGWQILRNVTLVNNLILANSLPGDTQGVARDLLFWMHNDREDRRTDASNHSDYNAFAADPAPILKPGYGHGNTRPLDQWRERFGEDIRSRVLPIFFQSSHAGFRLLATEGLDFAAPLPEEVTRLWQPRVPGQVGAGVASWPER